MQRNHPIQVSLNREDQLKFFRELKEKLDKRMKIPAMFAKAAVVNDDGLLASYHISKLIAEQGKSHTLGENLILPALQIILKMVLKVDQTQALKSIPLSNDSVRRRIDEMATDIEEKLCNSLRQQKFSLQLDESTVCDNRAILLAYVRYYNNGIKEEMLFAKLLETDTKGASILRTVQEFFELHNLPLTNILACATDGAPAMIGRHSGFIGLLTQLVPGVMTIHCVIHRHHLAARHLNVHLHQVLDTVIKAVNRIKARSLNDRLFCKLCQDNDEEFERLLLHTEARWLSRGNCLSRVYALWDTIQIFLADVEPALGLQLAEWRADVAYLADIFEKLNASNLQLQGTKLIVKWNINY